MAELALKILNRKGDTLCVSRGENEVKLVHTAAYEEGDHIVLETSEENLHTIVQVDDALGASFVYLTQGSVKYEIPFGEKRICYSPKVFYGNRHYLYARIATKEEIKAYRNLALNPMDQHGETNCYPHASANVETRGESVFAARNAIDGITENRSHGEWPYGSWGINRQSDACFRLEFGRKVEVDKIILYTRSDFPHDNWWKQVTFTFSDGSKIDFSMEKSEYAHCLTFEKKTISWLTLNQLIQSEDPSPFPALTQIEVYGVEENSELKLNK